MIIPKGALFTVTFVEHKDYHTMAVCIALVDIDIYEIQVEYLSLYLGEDNTIFLEVLE
jgi:hypothetical protein